MAKRRDSTDLKEFFEALGLKPKDKALFERSLTHRSVLNENAAETISNEKLEFLGDAILGAAVSEYLYLSHPDLSEGQLARRKSALVSEAALANLAVHFELGKYLVMGKGEEQTGGREKAALLADGFEAVLGAIYLDLGWKEAREFIFGCLRSIPLSRGLQKTQDAKSRLQEYTQRLYKKPPQYRVTRTKGPDHAKEFEIEVVVEGKTAARGRGKTKKEAEQDGATQALEGFENA
ncbi:MAG: ribonuclease III [candidate division FCPU426 bacterium]